MSRILFLILFLPIQTFGQEWVECYHDSTLIVTLPYYYNERELNGLRMLTARVEEAVIVVGHMPESPTMPFNVRDTSQLKYAYAAFRDGLLKSQGKLLKSDIIKKDGLQWIHFVARGVSSNSIDQVTHNLAVFVEGNMYSLSFFEMGPSTPAKDEARKKIFSSARIALGIPRKQVSIKFYSQPFSFNNVIRPIIIVTTSIGLCVAVVALIRRFKKKRSASASGRVVVTTNTSQDDKNASD